MKWWKRKVYRYISVTNECPNLRVVKQLLLKDNQWIILMEREATPKEIDRYHLVEYKGTP